MLSLQDDPMFEDDSPFALCDRREQERREPISNQTRLWVEGRGVPAEAIDVSENGIGLRIPDRPFAIGPRVEVDHDGKRRTGVVAYLNRCSNGDYRLGIEWISVPQT